ncbi:IS200/IS605 family element transposase accessory protein TnpB [Candidatus Woesearchaeota archaeon]|nr:IS200/IS605 family element transposase accessory protein TnpB [Candidatus Woesearchaeota archaeon]
MQVTAKIKINFTPELKQTAEIYRKGLQYCVESAWENKIKNNIKLHRIVYKQLRSLGLQSQLAAACIKQACGIVKKAKSKPLVKKTTVRYNFPRSASFKHTKLSLWTIAGRQEFSYSIPACFTEYFETWEVRESTLRFDKRGRCFFLFVFNKECPVPISPSTQVLGVDLGINKLAVTSDAHFFGKETKHLRRQYEKVTADLQARGTRAAKRRLRQRSGRWQRFMAWVNHNISKRIVASLHKGDVVVLEDLNGIRETARYNVWNHKWAFRQLQSMIEYKATKNGMRVVFVNPCHTSKECCVYHSLHTSRHGGFVRCLDCSHTVDADLAGSRNIAQRYTRNMSWAACKPALDLAWNDVKAHSVSVV